MSDQTRRFPLWLIASLAANALLIGAVGGLFAGTLAADRDRPEAHRGEPPGNVEQTLARRILSVVPSEERRTYRRRFAREWVDMRPLRRELRMRRTDLARAILAEPYDQEAVETALTALRNSEARIQAELHSTLAETLAGLTLEQRQQLMTNSRSHDGRPPPPGDRPPPPRFRDDQRRPPPDGE